MDNQPFDRLPFDLRNHKLRSDRAIAFPVEPYRYQVFLPTAREEDREAMRRDFAVRSRIRRTLAAHGLDIEVKITVCEPVEDWEAKLLVYPDGVWYRVSTPEEAEEIVRRHLVQGEVVEKLVVRRETRRCAFICSLDSPSCGPLGSPATREAVRETLRREGSDTVVIATNCLSRCNYSPNWVVYPEGAWYWGMNEELAERVALGHLVGGEIQGDHLATPDEPEAVASGPPSGRRGA